MANLSDLTGNPPQIFLLTENEELAAVLRGLWPEGRVDWTVFSSRKTAFDHLLNTPPDMVIADRDLPGDNDTNVLDILKKENVYRQICAVLVIRAENLADLPEDTEVDELLVLPSSPEEMRLRIELALRRATYTLDANPLTRLPGNTSIITVIQRLLGECRDFALAYVDMDHFKPYNDKYGFSRGDEALCMTARLLVNTVGSLLCNPSFVGHVGGDDFVFITPPELMEQACSRLIRDFDAIVPSFYDPEDQERGSIRSFDRQGQELEFPILSISVAVVINSECRYTHYAQLSHKAGELKKKAKATRGSNYVLDRRH